MWFGARVEPRCYVERQSFCAPDKCYDRNLQKRKPNRFRLQGGYVGFQRGGLWFKNDSSQRNWDQKTGLTKHNIDELTDDETHPPHLVASLLLVFFLCQNGHPQNLWLTGKNRKLLQWLLSQNGGTNLFTHLWGENWSKVSCSTNTWKLPLSMCLCYSPVWKSVWNQFWLWFFLERFLLNVLGVALLPAIATTRIMMPT